jgi:proteic killer suppression protein
MNIASIEHRGPKRFLEDDDERGIRRDLVPKVRNILSALINASHINRVEGPPGWKMHQLSGARAGTWSISVSGNWRITFTAEGGEITNLNMEGYH